MFLYHENLSCPDGSQMTPIKNCSTSLLINLAKRGLKKLGNDNNPGKLVHSRMFNLYRPDKNYLAPKGRKGSGLSAEVPAFFRGKLVGWTKKEKNGVIPAGQQTLTRSNSPSFRTPNFLAFATRLWGGGNIFWCESSWVFFFFGRKPWVEGLSFGWFMLSFSTIGYGLVWDSNRGTHGYTQESKSLSFSGIQSESKPPGPKPTINRDLIFHDKK